VTTANEYQRLAAECTEWARDASQTDAERKMFLLMARDWTEAAAKANAGIPVARPDDADPLDPLVHADWPATKDAA
jgi:hypothetical protein